MFPGKYVNLEDEKTSVGLERSLFFVKLTITLYCYVIETFTYNFRYILYYTWFTAFVYHLFCVLLSTG